VAAPLTRIISDLHYRDPGSWVDRLDRLTPLLDGVDVLVVNGDALDTQILAQPAERIAELKSFLTERVPTVTFVTGNHDPDISSVHELSLIDDSVWITHGDVFFDDVAPWSRLVGELRRRIQTYGAQLSPTERRKIETRFRIFRQACLQLPREHHPDARGAWAKFMRIGKAVFPPHRILAMMRVWRAMPALAAEFAAEQRERARIVVTGHTHFHGIWQRPHHLVINTGSFCAPRGGQVVDLFNGKLSVRRLVRRAGNFHAQDRVAEFTLASRTTPALSALA
jgi:predicted phosphodiesterase